MKSRAEIRGQALSDECRKAKTTIYEYGEDDNRVFCFGLIDCENDEYLKKCKECRAWVDNAEPPEDWMQKIKYADEKGNNDLLMSAT